MAVILARFVFFSGEIFIFFSKHCLQFLYGDLKMCSFYSGMEEIHRIEMETPDTSDVLKEYSSEYETTNLIYSSPEETENVNTVEAARGQHLKHVQIVMGKHRDGISSETTQKK